MRTFLWTASQPSLVLDNQEGTPRSSLLLRSTGFGYISKIGARQPLPYKNDPNARRDSEYYEQVIQPLLREPGVEMIGEVGGKDKQTLLRDAAALLFPIRWPEPFGLVMIEALACGTPVVALRQGSVPEVIDNGLTGWIVDTEDELVAALDHLGELDRVSCRSEAEKRFSARHMAVAYESIYERLVGQRQEQAAGQRVAGELLRLRNGPGLEVGLAAVNE